MSRHFASFRLSITRALGDQLAQQLEPLQPSPLNADSLNMLDRNRGGVYVLYHQSHRVYVGKAQKSLHNRLGQHMRKLSSREGLSLGDIEFVALYVEEDLDAVAPEKLLIHRMRSDPNGISWNFNGFGNKDPGKKRDTSAVPENHFDARYPADLSWPLRLTTGSRTLAQLLGEAKRQLPFTLRFESIKSRRAAAAYRAGVEVPTASMTTTALIELVVAGLPEGWQATALPGYVILYGETAEFESARGWWRRDGRSVEWTPHTTKLAPRAGEISEEADQD